ncbi:MAG: MoxR family ATPase [Nitrososphaerota archaeon]|nr:MoxR family ATPase [Nitrososphaerota archaeon]
MSTNIGNATEESNSGSTVQISIAYVKRLIKLAYQTRRAIFLHGRPGSGKSSMVRQVADELGIQLRDVRLNQLEPVDLRGLPMIEETTKATIWTVPDFLPRDGRGILFFDEFNTVDRSLQAPTLQLILDRRLGNYVLPDGWIVVAAGNSIEDRAHVYEMSSALNNRFFHIEFPVPTYEEWFDWGSKNGKTHPAILSFLNLKPSLLFKFDPKQKDPAWASPRSWELASDLLKADGGKHPEVVRYAVGEGASLEFEGWWRLREKIPDPEQLFRKPRETEVPNEISLQLVVATLIVERITSLIAKKSAEQKLFEALDVACILASRLPPEVQTICLKMLVSSNTGIPAILFKCPNWKPLGSRLAKYVMP